MTLMDMPRPMTKNNYNKIASNFAKVTETVANETMEEAIGDIKEQNNESRDSMTDVAISQDGTWQRRGYSSMNGCVTAIAMDNGKVVDVEPMSRFCRGCIQMDKFKITDPEKYDHWKLKHKCQYNYQGSAGGMEFAGAERIFGRSISKHNVRYTTLYGDGDSKPHIVDIYPGVKVNKLQCIGHVQKRVGSRLLSLKKRVKGLGGIGKLSKLVIDRLQNYYGIAFRQNVGNLEGMKKRVCASLFHVAFIC